MRYSLAWEHLTAAHYVITCYLVLGFDRNSENVVAYAVLEELAYTGLEFHWFEWSLVPNVELILTDWLDIALQYCKLLNVVYYYFC